MKVAVIGCGASGMMAAIAAAEAGATVTVFEKNVKPGKKLFITGKGRCNLTNDRGREDFFAHVRRNEKFLYSAYAAFDETAVQAFFTENGCPLKTERGGRVFPASDKSSDIINVLTRKMKELSVEVRYGAEVKSLLVADTGDVRGIACETARNLPKGRVQWQDLPKGRVQWQEFEADAVIVTCGGLSYPSTGSTGDGYALAKSVGHTVTETTPSEVPLLIKERDCFELQGLSLRNVAVTLDAAPGRPKKKRKDDTYEDFGEMLFTHFGVSGPLILAASSYYEAETEALLSVDLKPALTFEELDARVLRDFEAAHNKQFQNALDALFPKKLIPVMIARSGIDPVKRTAEVTREERQQFVRLIKNLTFTVTGTRGFKEAVVTRGGVNVKEIDPKTMQSKLCPGLYFAGEVMDLDAVTGGYNLQIAWSTGHLAGISAAQGGK